MLKLEYDRAEALRYFGAKAGDEQAANICDLVYLKLRNETMPRSTYVKMACTVLPEAVVLANGIRLEGKQLAKHLQGCTQVAIMAATLGPKVDAALRRLAITEIAQAAAAQAVAAALIEDYCNRIEEEIKAEYNSQAGETTYSFRWRYSPGYGDWPLEEQGKLFAILDCAKKIGLTLTAGGMMAPTKSVTAVIGVQPGPCPNRALEKAPGGKCATCNKIDCEFRGK